MGTMRTRKGLALAGALLMMGGACSKPPEEPAAAPAPAAPLKPEWPSMPSVHQEAGKTPPPPPAFEPESHPVAPQPPSPPLPTEIRVGQSREVVLGILGDCAERAYFLPGGSGNLSVEIVQPKEGECRKRLGERHFVLTGEKLERVNPGVLPPPGPPRRPPIGVF